MRISQYPIQNLRALSAWQPPIQVKPKLHAWPPVGLNSPIRSTPHAWSKAEILDYRESIRDIAHEGMNALKGIWVLLMGSPFEDKFEQAQTELMKHILEWGFMIPFDFKDRVRFKSDDIAKILGREVQIIYPGSYMNNTFIPWVERTIFPALERCHQVAFEIADELQGKDKTKAGLIRLLSNAAARPIKALLKNNGRFDLTGSPRSVNINTLIKDIQLARKESGFLNIETYLDVSLPDIFFDPDNLFIVLDNPIRNTLKAAKESGKTATCTVTTKAERRSGIDGVKVEVYDNGPGMPKELREGNHAFEKGVTTTGTGIGLSLVKGIVEANGGEIDPIESRTLGDPETTSPNKTFTKIGFWLPLESVATNQNEI